MKIISEIHLNITFKMQHLKSQKFFFLLLPSFCNFQDIKNMSVIHTVQDTCCDVLKSIYDLQMPCIYKLMN